MSTLSVVQRAKGCIKEAGCIYPIAKYKYIGFTIFCRTAKNRRARVTALVLRRGQGGPRLFQLFLSPHLPYPFPQERNSAQVSSPVMT